MPSEPALGIQVFFLAGFQGAMTEGPPDRGRKAEDVGSSRRHPTKMAFGSSKTRTRLGGIEGRPSPHAGSESDEPDSSPGLPQDVPGIDSAVHDVAFVGMGQTVGRAHRRLENGRQVGILELSQIRGIHEAGHQGELGRAQTITRSMNPQGRTNGRVREVRQDLVFPKDSIECSVLRRPACVLEDHEISSLRMSREEDTPIRIVPQSGQDPESMLDVACSEIRGIPRPTHAGSHCCHVALPLDPDTTVEMPPKMELQIENPREQTKKGRAPIRRTGRAGCTNCVGEPGRSAGRPPA